MTFKVYSFYFKAVGFASVLIIVMLNVVTQGLLGQMFCLRLSQILQKQPQETCVYGSYGAMVVAPAATIGFSTLIFAVGRLNASTTLHDNMLTGVLRAQMSFFDTNLKGRIVNRFAKDMDYVDFQIPSTFNFLLKNSFLVFRDHNCDLHNKPNL